ncbi:hypothetical protein [Arcobacter sp. LA11]|uniref:hypothetical protein n=1 Tax=Arcobacter sp. LA11 TaxID=1898176 RepID=UPI000932A1AA|nr:hypothetical protein [Arcobacter sp. LA11]
MKEFFILEAGLLTVSALLLAIIAFTTTRSFVRKGMFKKSFFGAFIFFALVITWHYNQTVDRMDIVKKEFKNGKTIVCDNKGDLTLGRNVLVQKDRYGWRIDDFFFISDEYPRNFHISRCVVSLLHK